MAKPKIETDEHWRTRARDTLESSGLTRKQVAQGLGTSQATLSRLLSGEIRASRLVQPLSDLLGIPTPTLPGDPDVARIARLIADLDPESQRLLERLARLLLVRRT